MFAWPSKLATYPSASSGVLKNRASCPGRGGRGRTSISPTHSPNIMEKKDARSITVNSLWNLDPEITQEAKRPVQARSCNPRRPHEHQVQVQKSAADRL